MEKDSPFGFDQGGNPTFTMPRAPVAPLAQQSAPAASFIVAPQLDTVSPLIAAERENDPERFARIAAAARHTEPRVRELIGLVREARGVLHAEGVHDVDDPLERIEFGLGGLLPPANIRISAKLANLISQSGRKRAG